MIKAVLIDLDGLLINSEELYLEANKIYFKKYNFQFTEDLHRQGTGKKFDIWIKAVTNIDKSGEEILRERNEVFFDLARKKLRLLPGVKELLDKIHNEFKTALVTSSKKDYIKLVFDLTGIESQFDFVISGEEVSKGKPDPECYLTAAKKLEVLPEGCVVLEDAPSGILAGKNAGMKVIAIPSQFVNGDQVFEKADLVLDSLEDLTVEQIKSI